MTSNTDTRSVASQELYERCNSIRNLMASAGANCHAIGLEYNYIVDNKLAEQAGFKNAHDFLTQQIKELSRTTLVTYGAVARSFSPEVCGRFGVTLLNLLLVYVEASGSQMDANEPGTLIVQVPSDSGSLEDKFFAECSVLELRKAIQRLRRPTSSAPLPPDVQARAQQCSKALTASFPKDAAVRVQVSNRRGEAVLSLNDVPLELAEQLTALLANGLQKARAA